ncbi:MAG TPA: Fe-Mn family superoxide dismutase, partial [Prolixibacteraceae bacterium]|nr:Fe-Mn family superoxide dismutase [Prolixibacteraceae bacterium]
WLVKRGKGELLAYSTANQNNPLMDTTPFRGKPVLCIDLWEHSYQSQYHDNRKAYIESFWNIVNWKKVAELYNK